MNYAICILPHLQHFTFTNYLTSSTVLYYTGENGRWLKKLPPQTLKCEKEEETSKAWFSLVTLFQRLEWSSQLWLKIKCKRRLKKLLHLSISTKWWRPQLIFMKCLGGCWELRNIAFKERGKKSISDRDFLSIGSLCS